MKTTKEYANGLRVGEYVYVVDGAPVRMCKDFLTQPWQPGRIAAVHSPISCYDVPVFAVRFTSGTFNLYGHDLIRVQDQQDIWEYAATGALVK